MIGRLTGQVVEIQATCLLIDVNGVGYVVQAPTSLITQTVMDQSVTLYIQTVVREDAITLYGFSSSDDRHLFELLVSVSGVGPKLALAVLSTYSASQVQTAVATANAAAFSAVSGIGKKNAERIILELRNKVATSNLQSSQPSVNPHGDITQALINLGYSGPEIAKVTQALDNDQPLETQIKQALRLLANP